MERVSVYPDRKGNNYGDFALQNKPQTMKTSYSLLIPFLSLLLFFSSQSLAQTSTVYFDYDEYELTEETKATLDALIATDDIQSIKLSGHTDHDGSDQYNIVLSRNRVNAVRDYLTEHGVDPEIVSIEYRGEKVPVMPNDNEVNKGYNRRVEIKWLDASAYNAPVFSGKKTYQKMKIDPTAENTIVGKKGTRITIPANALVDDKGNLVTGEVEIQLREFYTKSDLILNGMSTNAGNRFLETGGAVELLAFNIEGKELGLAEDQEVTLVFNTPIVPGVEMSTWLSNPTSAGMDWAPEGPQYDLSTTFTNYGPSHDILYVNINLEKGFKTPLTPQQMVDVLVENYWQSHDFDNLKAIQFKVDDEKALYLEMSDHTIRDNLKAKIRKRKIALAQTNDVANYTISSMSLGFINCDRLIRTANPIAIRIDKLGGDKEVLYYLVFKEQKAVIAPLITDQKTVGWKGIGSGLEVQILAFSVNQQKQEVLYGFTEFTTGEVNQKIALKCEIKDKNDFLEELSEL